MNFIDLMDINTKDKLISKTFEKGSTILFAEEENNYVYFLIEGRAEAYVLSPKGNYANLYIYREGSFFGEIEQFYEGRKPVEITAFTDCLVKMLHKDDFLKWLESDFNATKYLIKELSYKLVINAELVEDVLSLTVKERLLRSVAIHNHRNTLNTLSKNQLAKEVNTPMRSLNRAIASSIEEGVLAFENEMLIILDEEKVNVHLPK